MAKRKKRAKARPKKRAKLRRTSAARARTRSASKSTRRRKTKRSVARAKPRRGVKAAPRKKQQRMSALGPEIETLVVDVIEERTPGVMTITEYEETQVPRRARVETEDGES